MSDHEGPDHDVGTCDLRNLDRRRALALLGGGALAALAARGSNGAAASGDSVTTTPATSGTTATAGTISGECETIPEETAGPYPGDGSNGPNVLTEDGVVRSDIRSSFGSSTATADGIPLTIHIDLLDSTGCAPLAGAAVYLWHCDRDGQYSLYATGLENENYLRGVQESDADGRVTFTSIFPACYSGRWPHIHFEVYESLEAATSGGTRNATSQVAIPEDACNAVYATAGYEQSVENLAQVSLDNDNVFSDDSAEQQLATVTGDTTSGYTVQLTVAVNPDFESVGGSDAGTAGGPPGSGSGPGGTGPGGPPTSQA